VLGMMVFMKKVIKEFWNVLKSEYENEYKENIFKNYSQTEHVLKNFRIYLKDLFCKYPSNVDIVCVLASVELELRYEKNAINCASFIGVSNVWWFNLNIQFVFE